MKLISMTDFILEQQEKFEMETHIMTYYNRILSYAQFLKQPLKISMFVPCGHDELPLKKPTCDCLCEFDREGCPDMCFMYINATNKVLFEGFEIKEDKYKATKREIIYLPDGRSQVWRKLTFYNGNIEYFFFDKYEEFNVVEDLIFENINLTKSAIKQIGL